MHVAAPSQCPLAGLGPVHCRRAAAARGPGRASESPAGKAAAQGETHHGPTGSAPRGRLPWGPPTTQDGCPQTEAWDGSTALNHANLAVQGLLSRSRASGAWGGPRAPPAKVNNGCPRARPSSSRAVSSVGTWSGRQRKAGTEPGGSPGTTCAGVGAGGGRRCPRADSRPPGPTFRRLRASDPGNRVIDQPWA